MTPALNRQASPASDSPRSTIVYDKNVPGDSMKDNGGRALPADVVFRTNAIHEATVAAIDNGSSIMMIGALTSATNNFGTDDMRRPRDASSKHLAGIQAATLTPDIDGNFPYDSIDYRTHTGGEREVLSNEIRLNQHREGPELHTITIGAGVTFAQANHVLREAFGDDGLYDYCVPIDLTTIDIAHAGAVYATGAQGPSRFRIADIAKSITITNGVERTKLTDPLDIETHQGLWGLTGGVVEMELRVFRRPKNRFGFFIPLRSDKSGSWTPQAAAVIALLRDSTTLSLSGGQIHSQWKDGIVDGIEVVSRDSLELVANTSLPSGSNRSAAKKILGLMASREKNGTMQACSDFGVYITGNSRYGEVDGFLADEESPLTKLVEYSEGKEQFLHADGIRTIVDNPSEIEEMRLLRESFADIARQHAKHQAKGQAKPFSESTDINCFIDPEIAATMGPDELRAAYHRILLPYYAYESRIHDMKAIAKTHGVDVTLSRYGHLNPRSINPHTRVTVHAPEDSIHLQVYTQIILRAREHLIQVLMDISRLHPEIRVEGGEKGKMTNEAFDIMTDHQRMAIAHVLAEANPQFQPHLKGKWASLVHNVREVRNIENVREPKKPHLPEPQAPHMQQVAYL